MEMIFLFTVSLLEEKVIYLLLSLCIIEMCLYK